MKRKAGILLCVSLMTVLLIFGLVACQPNLPFEDTSTYEIKDKADFLAIGNRLGDGYKKTKYVLKQDLDFTDGQWNPVGSLTKAFTSTFDGQGHTIKIKCAADTPKPLEREESRSDKESRGLFAFLEDATIKNLTVEVDMTFNVNETVSYAGALAGFASGKLTLENVNVTGAMTATTVGSYSYRDNSDGSTVETVNNDETIFLGGVVGYLIGTAQLNKVKAEIDLNAMKSEEENGWWEENNLQHTFLYRDGAVGSIMGFVRPVDASVEGLRSAAQDLSASGNITVYAERINAGGLFGSIDKVDLVRGKAEVAMDVYTRYRMNAGGAFGYAGNSNLSAVSAGGNGNVRLNYYLLGDANTSRNAGGILGYLDGGKLEHAVADVTIDAVGGLQFGGGIAGIVKNATVDDVVVTGAVFHSMDGIHADSWSHDDGFGGIAGRLHGSAVVKNADVAVETFQGVAGEVLFSVSVETGAEENNGKDNVVTNIKANVDNATVTYVRYLAGARKQIVDTEDIPDNGIGTAVGVEDLPEDESEASVAETEALAMYQARRQEITERYLGR